MHSASSMDGIKSRRSHAVVCRYSAEASLPFRCCDRREAFAPPPKDSPAGGGPPEQGLVEDIKTLHNTLHAGHLLPYGREFFIYRHPACKAEVD